MSYLDRLKKLKRPLDPTDKTDESPEKGTFGGFGSGPLGDSANFSRADRRQSGEPSAQALALIKAACQGLSVTPDQLRDELTDGGDMPNVESGALSTETLRQVAEALSLTRYPQKN